MLFKIELTIVITNLTSQTVPGLEFQLDQSSPVQMEGSQFDIHSLLEYTPASHLKLEITERDIPRDRYTKRRRDIPRDRYTKRRRDIPRDRYTETDWWTTCTRKEMLYLTTLSTHFIYGYMVLDHSDSERGI